MGTCDRQSGHRFEISVVGLMSIFCISGVYSNLQLVIERPSPKVYSNLLHSPLPGPIIKSGLVFVNRRHSSITTASEHPQRNVTLNCGVFFSYTAFENIFFYQWNCRYVTVLPWLKLGRASWILNKLPTSACRPPAKPFSKCQKIDFLPSSFGLVRYDVGSNPRCPLGQRMWPVLAQCCCHKALLCQQDAPWWCRRLHQ